MAKSKYERALESRFKLLVSKSAQRRIPSSLTLEQYKELVRDGQCTYCFDRLPLTGFGIDRKNSFDGYHFDNCVPCCESCNRIRGKDLISHAEMIEVAKLLRHLRWRPDQPYAYPQTSHRRSYEVLAELALSGTQTPSENSTNNSA